MPTVGAESDSPAFRCSQSSTLSSNSSPLHMASATRWSWKCDANGPPTTSTAHPSARRALLPQVQRRRLGALAARPRQPRQRLAVQGRHGDTCKAVFSQIWRLSSPCHPRWGQGRSRTPRVPAEPTAGRLRLNYGGDGRRKRGAPLRRLEFRFRRIPEPLPAPPTGPLAALLCLLRAPGSGSPAATARCCRVPPAVLLTPRPTRRSDLRRSGADSAEPAGSRCA